MVACIDNRTISLNITQTLKVRLYPRLVRPQGTETTTDTDWKEVGTALTERTRTVRRHLGMEDDDNDE